MWGGGLSRQYERAAKVANSEGPYSTPEKEKQLDDSNVIASVFHLELNRTDLVRDEACEPDQVEDVSKERDHKKEDAREQPQ